MRWSVNPDPDATASYGAIATKLSSPVTIANQSQ